MVVIKNKNKFNNYAENSATRKGFIMKKILTIVFAVLMMASLGVTTLAANGAFINSPSVTDAPVLVDYESEGKDCEGKVVLTSYNDRAALGEDGKAAMEAAYSSIATATDLGEVAEDLKAVAEDLEITSDKLAVSDLFYLSGSDCDNHGGHGNYSVTLKPGSAKNYAGVMFYKDGEWQLVEGEKKGDEIIFEIADFAPYAIVVHDGSAAGPNLLPLILLYVIGILLIIAIAIFLNMLIKKLLNK